MKTTKLSVKEITELQPTRVEIVKHHRTVVGGLEISGDYDTSMVDKAVEQMFGDDCKAWDGEPDDGDGVAHVVVVAKL